MAIEEIRVLRSEDLLNLRFKLINLTTIESDPPMITRVKAGDAFLVVEFPPQHILEQITEEIAKGETEDPKDPVLSSVLGLVVPPTVPARTELSGPSQLAFKVKDSVTEFPRTLDALLSWQEYFDPVSLDSSPNDRRTSIEIPTRLMLAPKSGKLVWKHINNPPTSSGIQPLWHTLLIDLNNPNGINLAAIDFEEFNGVQFSSALMDTMREVIVSSMQEESKFDDQRVPVIEARQLMLSGLGGWLDTKPYGGSFIDKSGERHSFLWDHKTAMGRDLRVLESLEGVLLPFGHRAHYVRLSERKIKGAIASGEESAFLYLKQSLVVTQPYNRLPTGFRQLPIASVRIIDSQVDEIRPMCIDDTGCKVGDEARGAFWPMVGDARFEFELEVEDRLGNRSSTTLPLIWVNSELANNSKAIDAILKEYADKVDWRKAVMGGQKINYAPPEEIKTPAAFAAQEHPQPNQLANTTFETSSITFELVRKSGDVAGVFGDLVPVMSQAKVSLHSLRQLSGDREQPFEELIKYDENYLANGWSDSAGVFAQIVDAQEQEKTVEISSFENKWLTLALPPLGGMSELSANQGVIVDPDPRSYLKSALRKEAGIFGGILLEHVIDFDFEIGDVNTAPQFLPTLFKDADCTGEAIGFTGLQTAIDELEDLAYDPEAVLRDLDSVRAIVELVDDYMALGWEGVKDRVAVPKAAGYRFEWRPKIADNRGGVPFTPGLSGKPGKQTELELLIEVCQPFESNSEPRFSIDGTLSNFTIELLPSIRLLDVDFKHLKFKVGNGQDPVLIPDIREVRFKGILEFVYEMVEEFKRFLPGFAEGPSVRVRADRIEAGYVYEMKSMSVGVMSLKNVNIRTDLTIPFYDDPLGLKFSFADRRSPFLIVMGAYQGGGWLAVDVGYDGINWLEAGFEFGANLSLDLGVASGGVSASVGFYYHIGQTKQAELSGFIRIEGHLKVLNIVSVSAVFCLSLTYNEKEKDLSGQASLVVTVGVFMFKRSVSMTVERRLSRTSGIVGGYMAGDLVPEKSWLPYAGAFAPEAP